MIINLTPHTIKILDDDNNVVHEIQPEDTPARVRMESRQVGCATWNDDDDMQYVSVYQSTPAEVTGLPKPISTAVFIVSRVVQAAVPERKDLVVPNELVRDDKGNVIGCRSLSR